MVSVTNRFPLWGDVGEEPQDGFLYEGGDQVNKKHLNYLWDKIQKQTDDFITKTDDLQAQITAIDANGDGIVDEADTANLYKDNDIDTDGDGVVNEADEAGNAQTLQGLQPDDLRGGITSTQHVSTFTEPYISLSGDSPIKGDLLTETEYNLDTISSDGEFYIGGQNLSPRGLAISPDGTNMMIVGQGSDYVYTYTLSTPYDITSASYDISFYNAGNQDGNPDGITVSPDGTKMYIVGQQNENVYEYTLNTPWKTSGGVNYNGSYNIGTEEGSPLGVEFSSDGTKMYVVGSDFDAVQEYTLSTEWDIGTATHVDQFAFTENNDPTDLSFNDDGTKLFIIGGSPERIDSYNLSTAWDVSTATHNKGIEFTADRYPEGIDWVNGEHMYVIGRLDETVYGFQAPANSENPTYTVEFSGSEVFEWDMFTTEYTANGGSVTVNLLDENNNVIMSNLGQNEDISGISSDINFKVQIDVDTTNGYPTIHYLARRFAGGVEPDPVTVSTDSLNDVQFYQGSGNGGATVVDITGSGTVISGGVFGAGQYVDVTMVVDGVSTTQRYTYYEDHSYSNDRSPAVLPPVTFKESLKISFTSQDGNRGTGHVWIK